MHRLRRVIAFAVLLLLPIPAWGQSLRPAPSPVPTQLKVNLQSSPQLTAIPAGTQANLLVLLSPGSTLPLAEDRQVTIPVAGQIGTMSLPQGTFLVGKLTRAENTKGILRFESLIVGNRVYTVQATSAPLEAQLVYDPVAARQAQAAAQAAQQQALTTNALGQTGAAVAQAVGGFGGIGSLFGLAGSLFGSAQQAQANNDAVRGAAAAQKLSASLMALQPLSVQFQSEVNLTQPTVELPPNAQSVPASPPMAAPSYPSTPPSRPQ